MNRADSGNYETASSGRNVGAADVVFTDEEMTELNRMLDALPIQCDRYNSRFTDATVD